MHHFERVVKRLNDAISGSLLTELWGKEREAGAAKPEPCGGAGGAAGEACE